MLSWSEHCDGHLPPAGVNTDVWVKGPWGSLTPTKAPFMASLFSLKCGEFLDTVQFVQQFPCLLFLSTYTCALSF